MKTTTACLMLLFNLLLPATIQERAAYLPDKTLTPGDSLRVSKDDLCKSEYESPTSKVPTALKREVFDRYGINPNTIGYNVDHLIPVGLGGSNSIKNLWPQPLSGAWNYDMKNHLEKRLLKLVCAGKLELEQARREIATDWTSAYRKYIGESRKAP